MRLLLALMLTAAVALAMTACSGGGSGKGAGEGDAPGDGPRVVALDWRYEEILVALGVKPVGIVEIGKSAAPGTLEGELDGITSVGQAKQPNLEVIQSLEPTLILASPTRQGAIMDQLNGIAPTEAYPDNTYRDVLDSMDDIAAKLGKEKEAKEVRERIEAKIAEARGVVKPGTRAALVGWTKNTLYTWVDQSFPGSLLADAGYTYGYTGEKSDIESKTDVAELTGDKLPGMDLDVLFLYNDIDGFKATPWATAVPDIVPVEQDVWSRARGPLAAEAMLDQIIATAGK